MPLPIVNDVCFFYLHTFKWISALETHVQFQHLHETNPGSQRGNVAINLEEKLLQMASSTFKRCICTTRNNIYIYINLNIYIYIQ